MTCFFLPWPLDLDSRDEIIRKKEIVHEIKEPDNKGFINGGCLIVVK